MMVPLTRSADPATLSEAEFSRVAAIARREAGLSLSDGKRAMIASRLARRLRATGLPDFAAYLAHLESDAGRAERDHLISALTTNVTSFFREAHHFRTFESTVLPRLADRARAGGRVRLWSAGCSTGQEPYSLTMSLLRALPDAARLDIRILATDIDISVLATAERGRYPAAAAESLEPALRKQFLREVDDGTLEVRADLRSLIQFRPLNLIGPWPFRGPFDVIFCRNVVIYFDSETQAALWPRLHQVLAPGGVLFIGHSERLDPDTAARLASDGVTTYRKPGTAPGGQAEGAARWH
jgi:chemotaxis protein methyltransferase CheR